RAYEEALTVYKQEYALWQEEQEAYRQERLKRFSEITGATENGGAVVVSEDGTTTRTIPQMGAMEAPPKPEISIDDAPKEIIDTPLYRVEISSVGARPINWVIKSSEFVTNVTHEDQDEEEAVVQLIP